MQRAVLLAVCLYAVCQGEVAVDARAQGITPQSIITTIAGTGRAFRGDGGAATSAALGLTGAVAVDASGNVFATDGSNNLVVKITPSGVITVVAGNNIRGFSGDGGPATSASLNLASCPGCAIDGLAVDRAGNLYISDTFNHRVRKLSPDGMINTVIGNGTVGFSGDGGPAASARLTPAGLGFDTTGNLYIADFGNHRIRMVRPDGIISTVAGNGTAGFSGDGGPATNAALNSPRSVAVDGAGNLYIADIFNFRVRKVSPNGIITTIAGTGINSCPQPGAPAVNSSLSFPPAVAVDEIGTLYISSCGVRKVTADGTLASVVGVGATSLAFAGRTLYLSVDVTGQIRRVTPDGVISTIAGTSLSNFSGDGGPAYLASLSLSGPMGLSVDAAGNVLIADQFNHRVRRVDTSGNISTVAGNGNQSFSGDGGPATAASLNSPQGVTADGLGNLYVVDTSNSRVRKVDPAGMISTVAGGRAGFSGDGGPATGSALSGPADVAVDQVGNIYIADRLNRRIRKVNPAGVITTFAGNGNSGFSGDGVPATQASMDQPYGVAVDRVGNLYIADGGNDRGVRQVRADGIIRTFAGGGSQHVGIGAVVPATSAILGSASRLAFDAVGNLLVAGNGLLRVSADGASISRIIRGGVGFSGDGSPARNAQLSGASGIASDSAGNVYLADHGNDRVRKIWAAAPSLAATPAALSFRSTVGAGSQPQQLLTVSSSLRGLLWSARATTTASFNWLSVSPSAGEAPGTIAVSADVGTLPLGTYQGAVEVSNSGASPPSVTVPVTLTVGPPVPPSLGIETTVSFEATIGEGNPPAQTLRILNTGGGSLSWTAQATTVTPAGGDWLSLSQNSGTATPTSPVAVLVNANVGRLAAGIYSGVIRVESTTTGEASNIPVTLLITAAGKMLLSQRGLTFTGVAAGSVVPSQNFGVLNIGRGVMNWTAEAATLAGGPWLSVAPARGASTAGSLAPPLVDVQVNTAGLSAGQYSGQIQVTSTEANNSPQFITVTLTVLPAGSTPPPVVRPTGLIFVRQAGTSSPGSQTVRIQTAAPGGQAAAANAFSATGTSWLSAESVQPQAFTFSAADPRTIVVQPTLGSLPVGEYFGVLTLAFPRDSSSQTVNVLFVVTPGSGAGSASALSQGTDAGTVTGSAGANGCTPQRLFVAAQSFSSNFSVPVGYPALILAQIKDDCDNLVSNALVTASFDNGDRPQQVVGIGNGLFQTSWLPGSAGQRAVTVTLRAVLAPLRSGETRLNGQIVASAAPLPTVNSGGIVNAASSAAGEPLAPGSIVSVYGNRLGSSASGASVLPLPTTLADASLNVAGRDVPLFYSSNGQINAQLPFDLPPNSRQQAFVRVRSGGLIGAMVSVPETITVAATRPAIFTINQQGTGQGAILNQDSTANSSSNPEAPGRVVQIFATGLGVTSPAVPAGAGAPSSPPASAITPVQATIGNQPAAVQFAGLAPGFVGLYQVNVLVPATVQRGEAVPLVLRQDGVPSNTVTLAIR